MKRGGWGAYARKHRAKVGDTISYQGKSWIIYQEHGTRSVLEDALEKNRKYLEDNPSMAELLRGYTYKIRKTRRTRNYKRYPWYQLLRNKYKEEPST